MEVVGGDDGHAHLSHLWAHLPGLAATARAVPDVYGVLAPPRLRAASRPAPNPGAGTAPLPDVRPARAGAAAAVLQCVLQVSSTYLGHFSSTSFELGGLGRVLSP
jgi:hypothetical protein